MPEPSGPAGARRIRTARGTAGAPRGDSDAASAPTASVQVSSEQGSGVGGTFVNGVVEYLAPDKYIVAANIGDQQFYVSADTEILGAVDGGAWSGSDLEYAVKRGGLFAEVETANGIAVSASTRDERPPIPHDPAPRTPAPGVPGSCAATGAAPRTAGAARGVMARLGSTVSLGR
ncbi:hypothetical protein [Streptomyces sp. NPDC127119]|uniref:hypothetical protein n=1 Tax=Streptomyces sp. NPDC127119 TaxID=3345370 RepID=UPI00363982B9